MQAGDIEMFEALAGDLLSALGYQRAFDAISPTVSADARQFRDWFEANVAPQPREEPPLGFEPRTCGLQNRCSAIELRWRCAVIISAHRTPGCERAWTGRYIGGSIGRPIA